MLAYFNGGKAILCSTSMAAPHVAGVAAKFVGEVYKNPSYIVVRCPMHPQDVEDELVKE